MNDKDLTIIIEFLGSILDQYPEIKQRAAAIKAARPTEENTNGN